MLLRGEVGPLKRSGTLRDLVPAAGELQPGLGPLEGSGTLKSVLRSLEGLFAVRDLVALVAGRLGSATLALWLVALGGLQSQTLQEPTYTQPKPSSHH